jgi:hypothetical protein
MIEKQYKEWLFEFGLYHPDGRAEISESDCCELMDLIIEWAESKALRIGGGYGPGDEE